MTEGSSGTGPTTSEIASVTTAPRAAAASQPPLMADRCLRTQFIRSIGTPARSSDRVACTLSSRLTPGTGTASAAEAPPDSSSTSNPSPATCSASASAWRPAARLPPSGTGCPTRIHSSRPRSKSAGRLGAATRPALTSTPRRARYAAAIGAAALPAATSVTGRPATASTCPLRPSARATSLGAAAPSIPAAAIASRWRRRTTVETFSGSSSGRTRPTDALPRQSHAAAG